MKTYVPMACSIAPIITVFAISGCSTEHYRAETELHADGRIDRAIYQPGEETPVKARQPALWERTLGVEKIEPVTWKGRIADLPPWDGDGDAPCFAGWNLFNRVDEIPDYLVLDSPDKTRQGRLVRDVHRIDLVFVTEHGWRETLSDAVTLDDMHAAAGELAEFYAAYVDDVLEAGLGEEYDHQRLIDWMNDEGEQWFVEMTNAYFECGLLQHLGSDHDARLKKRLEQVAARHGLNAIDKQSTEEFSEKRLRELVRRKDGAPLSDEVADSILIWASLKEAQDAQGESVESPLKEVAKKVMAAKYGGEEEFSQKMGTLASRIWGLYGPLTQRRQFDYSITMPGTIVETSGTMLADNRVRWSFRASEAYPLGYHMTCRSLEPNEVAMNRLLGGPRLKTRESLLAYVDLVSNDEATLAILKQCVERNSLSPLIKLRAKLEAENEPDSKPLVRIRRLWKLLEILD